MTGSTNSSYQAKLRDPRWKKRRSEIIQLFQGLCGDCSKPHHSLQVHHCVYVPGLEPWEYPDETLLPLCAQCHTTRQEAQNDAYLAFGIALRETRVEDIPKFTEALCALNQDAS